MGSQGRLRKRSARLCTVIPRGSVSIIPTMPMHIHSFRKVFDQIRAPGAREWPRIELAPRSRPVGNCDAALCKRTASAMCRVYHFTHP